MKRIKGKFIADNILKDLAVKIKNLPISPMLAVILVGNDPASRLYVKLKNEAAKKIGLGFKLFSYPQNISQKALVQNIKKLNQDNNITGIIVQLPLPKNLNREAVIQSINPQKDADGFHSKNIARFLAGEISYEPIFPQALMAILEQAEKEKCFSNLDKIKRQAMIIARSEMLKKILRVSLEKRGWRKIDIIDCTELNKNLNKLLLPDLVITACGELNLFSVNNLKNPTLVIDGGIVKIKGKVKGDFNVENLNRNKGCYSPVPGGVGPITVACLLKKVIELAQKSALRN